MVFNLLASTRRGLAVALALASAGSGLAVATASAQEPRMFERTYPEVIDPRTTFLVIYDAASSNLHKLQITQEGCVESRSDPVFEGQVLPSRGRVYFTVIPPPNQEDLRPCGVGGGPLTFRLTGLGPDGRPFRDEVNTYSAINGTGRTVIPFVDLDNDHRNFDDDGIGRHGRYRPVPASLRTDGRVTVAIAGFEDDTRYLANVRMLGEARPSTRCKQTESTVPVRTDHYGRILAFDHTPSNLSITGFSPFRRWCPQRNYKLRVKKRDGSGSVGSAINLSTGD